MLKAVTFDLWNTVIKEQAANSIQTVVIDRLTNILARHEVARPKETIRHVSARCRDKVMNLQVTEGQEMPPEEQLAWILAELNITATDQLMTELYEAYTTASLEQMPEAMPGIGPLLEELKKYVDLALICNTGRTPGSTARVILERLGLKKHFSHLLFSNEVGVAKPHPKIFRQALAALGVQPQEAAHIGDDTRTDVRGARIIGMQALWLAHGQPVEGVECDLVVYNWEDVMRWVKQETGT